jgi:protein-S-isoprenylcysteine O-methyltransferase Ste14
MLTYTLSNNATNNGGRTWNELSTGEQVTTIVVIILIIALIVWAWMRALKCSAKSPDSRAIHLLFASTDPILYLIFSYFIDGMCN